MEGINISRLAERIMKDFGLEEKITKEELENHISLEIPKSFAFAREILKECELEDIKTKEEQLTYLLTKHLDKMNVFKEEKKRFLEKLAILRPPLGSENCEEWFYSGFSASYYILLGENEEAMNTPC